jgi:murein DD-endopeptidase MepM/ murein hydrolase activator NlpD
LAVVDTVNAGQGYSPKAAKKELAAAATITVTVAPGDSLSALAARHCGNGSWAGLYEDNKSVVGANPNLIYPGQKLVINCATGTAATAPAPVAPTPAAAPASSGWVRPVDACISSGYGWRWGRMHNGTDLDAAGGTAIRAAAAGTVSVGWQDGGAGNYTMINHGDGVWTVYMHQSGFAVKSGWVDAGQTIGYVGSTGDSTGNHLHFEVHTGGLWNGVTNPVPFMANHGAALGC